MTQFDPMRIRLMICVALTVVVVLASARMYTGSGSGDVRYEPSPPAVVDRMLEIGKANSADVMYDLGSGDGRFVIAAARDFGVERAIGVEIDPELVARSRANAAEAGVTDQTRFVQSDLFEYDFSDADLVTLFLLPRLNVRLRPRLLAELEPGTRVVSHLHDMGDWRPDANARVEGHEVYLWIIPARIEGRWTGQTGGRHYELALQQLYQGVGGTLEIDDRRYVLADARLRGRQLRFDAMPEGGRDVSEVAFEGYVENGTLRGTLRVGAERIQLRARRDGSTRTTR